jgi:hypothetical protein
MGPGWSAECRKLACGNWMWSVSFQTEHANGEVGAGPSGDGGADRAKRRVEYMLTELQKVFTL